MVLGSLDGLYIEGDWHSGSDFSGLDNVILNAGVPPSSVPEPSTWFLFATGLVGVLGYGRRQKQKGDVSRIVNLVEKGTKPDLFR